MRFSPISKFDFTGNAFCNDALVSTFIHKHLLRFANQANLFMMDTPYVTYLAKIKHAKKSNKTSFTQHRSAFLL